VTTKNVEHVQTKLCRRITKSFYQGDADARQQPHFAKEACIKRDMQLNARASLVPTFAEKVAETQALVATRG
jgi:hypothetical protein